MGKRGNYDEWLQMMQVAELVHGIDPLSIDQANGGGGAGDSDGPLNHRSLCLASEAAYCERLLRQVTETRKVFCFWSPFADLALKNKILINSPNNLGFSNICSHAHFSAD